MKTSHRVLFDSSKSLSHLDSNSVDLMLTSPPYPMIEMWDDIFSKNNPKIKKAIENNDGRFAFNLMHAELDSVWTETFRVLKNGGIACINIGDATRTVDGIFQLYSNHSRILQYCLNLGFCNLPAIIWRKQTNAPNKFMGSGMLPAGAYVTLEHEYILILRKGGKREFSPEDAVKRREGAFFWEERNNWFSDVWTDLKGTAQKVNGNETRDRNAAFPFELAYRLINMFSGKNDIVLDPYLGTGTTTVAAMASQRNSIGIEIDTSFKSAIRSRINNFMPSANEYILERINKHLAFVKKRSEEKGDLKYKNNPHGFPVMTRQEVDAIFCKLTAIGLAGDNTFEASYKKINDMDLGDAGKTPDRAKIAGSKTLKLDKSAFIEQDSLSIV